MDEKKGNWSVTSEIRAEQKAALKNMKAKAKLAYYWEYYRIHALVAIISIVVGISLIYNIANNKDYSFYALIINSFHSSGEEMAEEFSEFSGLDNERLKCFIEADMVFNVDEFSTYEIAAVQRIAATVMAGDLDVMITDAHTFIYFSDSEFFVDLRSVLSEAALKQYQDHLFYIDQATLDKKNAEVSFSEYLDIEIKTFEQRMTEIESRGRPEHMTTPIPVGIFLTDTSMNEAYYENSFPVFGIIGSSGRLDSAVMYLEFLFSE